MKPFFRGLLAVVLGLLLGSALNMGLLQLGGRLVPPPAGADVSTMAGLKAALPLFEFRHFVFPFLAHALGTWLGALVASAVVAGRSRVPAGLVGGLFLLGGITNVLLLSAPMWFNAADLLLAYLPAAWLGHRLAVRLGRRA